MVYRQVKTAFFCPPEQSDTKLSPKKVFLT